MVAYGHRVVSERVHNQHHRIDRPVVLLVVIELQRRSLNGVTRIKQHQIWIFFPHLAYQRRNLREPAPVRLFCVIVFRKNVSVQISRTENGDVYTRRLLRGSTERKYEKEDGDK